MPHTIPLRPTRFLRRLGALVPATHVRAACGVESDRTPAFVGEVGGVAHDSFCGICVGRLGSGGWGFGVLLGFWIGSLWIEFGE